MPYGDLRPRSHSVRVAVQRAAAIVNCGLRTDSATQELSLVALGRRGGRHAHGLGTCARRARRRDGGSGDLKPQKARVLLTLALTRSSDPSVVAGIFQAQQ